MSQEYQAGDRVKLNGRPVTGTIIHIDQLYVTINGDDGRIHLRLKGKGEFYPVRHPSNNTTLLQ